MAPDTIDLTATDSGHAARLWQVIGTPATLPDQNHDSFYGRVVNGKLLGAPGNPGH